MTRSTRIIIFTATLLILVGGTTLASRLPRGTNQGPLAASQAAASAEEPEAPPAADELAHALDRLQDNGITATQGQLSSLAAQYGLGGAVRLFAWSDQTGISIANLRARRDSGEGWGQLAKELGVSPSLGSIMGGHGRDTAPGQLKDKTANDDEAAAE
jgi:hypothetical protein